MKKYYAIEIDWKPGVRRLWAGIADIVTTDPRHAFKRKDRAKSELAAKSFAIADKHPKVVEVKF